MLVGLMSDTHDRLPAVRELLKEMTQRGVGMVLHAGDYCSPFALRPFQENGVALAGVFGLYARPDLLVTLSEQIWACF